MLENMCNVLSDIPKWKQPVGGKQRTPRGEPRLAGPNPPPPLSGGVRAGYSIGRKRLPPPPTRGTRYVPKICRFGAIGRLSAPSPESLL